MALVQVAVLVTSHAINDPTTCNFAAGVPVPIPTLPLKLDRITFPPTFHQLITTLPQVSPSSVEAALIFKLLFPKSANHMFLSPQSLENPKP